MNVHTIIIIFLYLPFIIQPHLLALFVTLRYIFVFVIFADVRSCLFCMLINNNIALCKCMPVVNKSLILCFLSVYCMP